MPEVVSEFVTVGREAVKLTEKEAKKYNAELAKKQEVKDTFRYEDLPVITFPIKFSVTGRPDFTGDIGGVRFENGVTTQFHPWRRVNHISAAFAPAIDAKTGLTLGPLYENRTYTAANKTWNYNQPLPEHCLDETPTPVAEVIPPKVAEPAAAKQEPLLDQQKIENIVKAIARLRPGHKDDWTEQGLPDANRLADIINEKVFVGERDEAWAQFKAKGVEFEGGAFGLVAVNGADLKTILTEIGRHKGAAYLRQEARRRGLNEPRALEDIVNKLIEGGITLDDAKAL